MFASLYGLTGGSDSNPKPIWEVKVRNLSKLTSREDLKSRLSQLNVLEVKLIHCQAKKVNYAYIHVPDNDAAHKVAEAIHLKMTIHGNLLRAIVREDNPALNRDKLIENVDINLVEIFLYSECLPSDLEKLFSKYGEVESVTMVQRGSPSVYHLRYSRALSAYVARLESHTTDSITAVALPLPQQLENKCEFKTESFPCGPLVLKEVYNKLLTRFADKSQAEFLKKDDSITGHFHIEMTATIQSYATLAITTCESELDQTEFEMHYSYLPILASANTKEKINGIQTSCEIKVRRGATYNSLHRLYPSYSSCTNPTESSFIAPFLSRSRKVADKINYQWYWQDDYLQFQCCTEEINKRFEQNFKTTPHLLQKIGRFDYIINFENMTQTNITTGKRRLLKRKEEQNSEDWVIILLIKAHKNLISQCKLMIVSILTTQITKAKLEVPSSAIQTDSFQDTLKDIKKRFLRISSEGDQNTTLLIEGKNIVVQTALSDLQSKILKIVAEKSFHATIPNTWEKQINKCELKNVVGGTVEWKNIQDKMVKPNFMIRIKKIERIQNTWLWELYQLSKKRMSEKNDGEVNEKSLFHGTKQTAPRDIYDSEQGFDNRLASQGLWGEGTYFAASAKYSDAYAHTLGNGYKQMFLVQVVTGISCQMSSSERILKAPPKKEDHASLSTLLQTSKFEGERYDSVTGHSNNSKIYVIYELGRVYPAYLVTYMI